MQSALLTILLAFFGTGHMRGLEHDSQFFNPYYHFSHWTWTLPQP